MVDYYPGDGKVQNVHTKRITKIPTTQFEELKEERYKATEHQGGQQGIQKACRYPWK